MTRTNISLPLIHCWIAEVTKVYPVLPVSILSFVSIYRGERNVFREKAKKAYDFPGKYFSVSLDGMDQSKTDCQIPNCITPRWKNAGS